MSRLRRGVRVFVLLPVALIASAETAAAAPEGQMVLAQTISIAPRWFDPRW